MGEARCTFFPDRFHRTGRSSSESWADVNVSVEGKALRIHEIAVAKRDMLWARRACDRQ